MTTDPYADFPDLLAVDPGDTDEIAALEDAETIEGLTQGLWRRRKEQRRTQAEVGDYMGLTQSPISDIDTGRADPRLSVLMMYARAVGSRVVISLDGHDVRRELSEPRSLRDEYVPVGIAPMTRRSPGGWGLSRSTSANADSWTGVAKHG